MEETKGRNGVQNWAPAVCASLEGRISSQVETHLDRWCHKPLDPNDPSSLNP